MPLNVKFACNKVQLDSRYNRRRFLQLGLQTGVAAAAMWHLPQTLAAPSLVKTAPMMAQSERSLSFVNLHTGEHLKATYWIEGEYQTDELAAINYLLRDFRTGDNHPIDRNLLNLLLSLQHKVHGKQPFQVISGYRSPKTNAILHSKSNGVAKKSLHMQGKAIDIRLPGCQLSDLRKAAMACQAGGVGYYSKSNFIHVDTGRVRYWGA